MEPYAKGASWVYGNHLTSEEVEYIESVCYKAYNCCGIKSITRGKLRGGWER